MSHATETSVKISRETRDRLKEVKPFPNVTYDELLADMAAVYAGEKPRPHRAQAGSDSAASDAEAGEFRGHRKTAPGGVGE